MVFSLGADSLTRFGDFLSSMLEKIGQSKREGVVSCLMIRHQQTVQTVKK